MPDSEIQRTSWTGYGRTRCPKNLPGTRGDEAVTTPGTSPTGDPSGATAGYETENQRFLHMFLNTSIQNEDRTITVWGYNYAFGVWAPLVRGSTAITIAANNSKTHKIVEIAGTDRVYFKINSLLHASNKFFAACNTF